MRVLHVIPSLSARRGGPSTAARTMAEALAGAGVEVHVAATDDDGAGRLELPLGRPLAERGVTYWYFPRQTRLYTASLPLARWLASRAAGFDLLHVHGMFSFAPVAAAAAAAARGVPYILRPLGTLSPWGLSRGRALAKRLSLALLERRALAGAAAVHFTSEQERREAAALGVRHRAAVVPLPVDVPGADLARARGRFRAAHPAVAGSVIALFLARVDPKKGLDLLLPALAAARAQPTPVALAVAGDGDPGYIAALRARAAGLGLGPEALVWAGFLEGDARLAALADADLFVLPSYAENFGVAAVEALAAGLPVLLSDQVGIHHEVAAARAGLVVPCAQGALAAALARLAADAGMRAAAGRAARRLAAERFAPDAVIARLVALYRDVTESRTP